MANSYTAIPQKDGDWWISWVEEVPGVNCQERTEAELLESLRVTLREALQLNREDAARFAAPGYPSTSNPCRRIQPSS
jgi:predicted RNase H-like HicB family nuclease